MSMPSPRTRRWKYIWVDHGPNQSRIFDIGITVDGNLINPRGYNESVVREAIGQVLQRETTKKKASAAKRTDTLARRRARELVRVVAMVMAGQRLGPQVRCALCSKELRDPVSIDRGVGAECWAGLMQAVEQQRAQ